MSDDMPASVCTWTATRPESAHGVPEWRMAGMCVHEHLERALLCSACKADLERWQLADSGTAAPYPWCARCYRMRPGGHHCTSAFKVTPLSAPVP